MTFDHSTQAANMEALRSRYRDLKGVESARVARWLHANLTVAQVKNFFNLTDAQVTALRAKWATLRDHLNAVDAAVGE
jgi:hypothetical protein